MAITRTFPGVTLAVLQRMRAMSDEDYSLVLNADGKSGTLSGKSPLGDVVIGFEYAEERAEVTLTIIEKPIFVPISLLWAEFSYAVRRANDEPNQELAERETMADEDC